MATRPTKATPADLPYDGLCLREAGGAAVTAAPTPDRDPSSHAGSDGESG
jgi:hypothetical protein